MSSTAYLKVASHEARQGSFSRCLLLYSGGLDTSVMLKWIRENYGCGIITLTVDLGQRKDDLAAIRRKALSLGALEARIVDAKHDFAENMLSDAIMANADYQGGYALSTPLGRVTLAQRAVETAHATGCSVIAHGCTGKGNDQLRIEGYVTTLDPSLKTIAPVREWGLGRSELIAYAKENAIPVKQQHDKPYSYDENLWGNTCEGGHIEDPSKPLVFKDFLQWCVPVEEASAMAETLSIDFIQGVPVAFNGETMKLADIVACCNQAGAAHGIGVYPLIEDRITGVKVRAVYEQPGAAILLEAHDRIAKLVSTREENEFKSLIDQKWAYLLYAARWYDPVMTHLRAYLRSANSRVSGRAILSLFKGNVTVKALEKVEHTLYRPKLASFERFSDFNQNAAAGFAELYHMAQKNAFIRPPPQNTGN